MKAVILAGGLGTRLAEETTIKPKPMVNIGSYPILWHIMKIYHNFGVNEFIICTGHKGYVINEYFHNYLVHSSDVTFDLQKNNMTVHKKRAEDWKITVIDTGSESMTGGRLKRVKEFIGNNTFFFTYGDGLGDIDIVSSLEAHKTSGKEATITAVQPPGRFGALNIVGKNVINFNEKPLGDGSWINGGFFVLEPSVLNYIEDDSTTWESTPLEFLSSKGELNVFKHHGFWSSMDTIRDKLFLNDLWQTGNAPWKIWD